MLRPVSDTPTWHGTTETGPNLDAPHKVHCLVERGTQELQTGRRSLAIFPPKRLLWEWVFGLSGEQFGPVSLTKPEMILDPSVDQWVRGPTSVVSTSIHSVFPRRRRWGAETLDNWRSFGMIPFPVDQSIIPVDSTWFHSSRPHLNKFHPPYNRSTFTNTSFAWRHITI